MIKQIKNELVKVFKGKTFYLLIILFFLIIIFDNGKESIDSEIKYVETTKDIPITTINEMEKIPEDGLIDSDYSFSIDSYEYYDLSKAIATKYRLYNEYEENSWQRFALKDEGVYAHETNLKASYSEDILEILKNICDFELNPNTNITEEIYENSKIRYNEYVNVLNSGTWQDFINLKIKYLKEMKDNGNITKEELNEIDFKIGLYSLRLTYNISFGSSMQNQYLKEYRNAYYYNDKANMALYKYAIENNIEENISNENNLLSHDHDSNARISLIRIFNTYDWLIVIMAIYLSISIIAEKNENITKTPAKSVHKTTLISKIIACIIALVIVIIFIVISQYIFGGIMFGFDSYKLNYLAYDYNSGEIVNMNLFQYIMLTGLTKLPMYFIIIVFCMFMRTVNNHAYITVALASIIYLLGTSIIPAFSEIDKISTVARYFITNNWDFSIYLFGKTSNIPGITLYNSIIVYLIYLLILLYALVHKFNKSQI